LCIRINSCLLFLSPSTKLPQSKGLNTASSTILIVNKDTQHKLWLKSKTKHSKRLDLPKYVEHQILGGFMGGYQEKVGPKKISNLDKHK